MRNFKRDQRRYYGHHLQWSLKCGMTYEQAAMSLIDDAIDNLCLSTDELNEHFPSHGWLPMKMLRRIARNLGSNYFTRWDAYEREDKKNAA